MAKRKDNSPPNLLIKLQYYPSFKALTHEEVGRLFMALMEYAVTGDNTLPLKNEALLFPMMKADRDSDVAAWEDTAAKNRENGKKGGRPRKNQQCENDTGNDDETQENPVGFLETQKTPYTDTDTDTETTPLSSSLTKMSVESVRSGLDGCNYLTDYDDLTATVKYAEACIKGFTRVNAQEIVERMTQGNTMTGELVRYAIDEACGAGKTDGWGYTHNILERYKERGFKTLQDAKTDAAAFSKAKREATTEREQAQAGPPTPRIRFCNN